MILVRKHAIIVRLAAPITCTAPIDARIRDHVQRTLLGMAEIVLAASEIQGVEEVVEVLAAKNKDYIAMVAEQGFTTSVLQNKGTD